MHGGRVRGGDRSAGNSLAARSWRVLASRRFSASSSAAVPSPTHSDAMAAPSGGAVQTVARTRSAARPSRPGGTITQAARNRRA